MRRRVLLSVLLGAALVMAGCGPAMPNASLQAALEASTVPFRTVYTHRTFRKAPEMKVITSLDEHAAYFADTPLAEETLVQLPDFSHEVGILVQFPTQGSSSFPGEITRVEERPEALVVHSVLWGPDPGSTPNTAIGSPFHYIAIARPTKPITFAPTVEAELRQRPADKPLPDPATPIMPSPRNVRVP